MLFRYFVNSFETVPVPPIVTGIIVSQFHMYFMSTVRSFYYKTFSGPSNQIYIPKTAKSTNIYVPCSFCIFIIIIIIINFSLKQTTKAQKRLDV